MRLTELEPWWLKWSGDPGSYRHIDSKEGANGICFLCPKCFAENGGPVGTHRIICWEPSVPQTIAPSPGRWTLQGTSFDDLTLVAGSSSVLLLGGCAWHGFIEQGGVRSV